MADFNLRVIAETQEAERRLRDVDKAANAVAKDRSIKFDLQGIKNAQQNFKDIQSNLKDIGNNIQTFYRISKNIPGLGERVQEFESLAKGTANIAKNAPQSAAALRENAKAGSILSNSLEAAGGAAGRLINNMAKVGFAMFAVKEAVGVLQGAFGGFFNETIGREIRLRETILKTQTTLASTSKVFRNNQEITDPFQKIVSLTGEVNKRIDSIRERSIALAGVTSNEVIEVFGIVASQVGQIGGGLKEAEDLAINFSAALGTFGIPLYQARQEIGSILRGDITMDSYLAKALGITNEDVAKAKSQTGGVVKFLEDRLGAAVAGQKIAAQGFAGVVSNIKDLSELINQRFGAGLLDPMLGGLTKVFDFLFKIREQLFAISGAAGTGIGQVLSTTLGQIIGTSSVFQQLGSGAQGFAAKLTEDVKRAFKALEVEALRVVAPLRNIFEEITKSVIVLGQGLAKLAQGFISIKIEEFKALVQLFSNLAEGATVFASALSGVLSAYGSLLQQPIVQYLSQISAQFKILEQIGVMSAVKLAFVAVSLIGAWQPIVTFFQGLVAKVAALLGGLVIAVGAAVARIGAVIGAFAATLTATYPAAEALKQQLLGLSASLTAAGASADKAGASIARFGGATAGAARTVGMAIAGFVKFNLVLLGVQLLITGLIDAFGRYQQQQDNIRSTERARQALRELSTTYANVGEDANSATKSARDFARQIVDAEYSKAQQELESIRRKLNDLNYEAQFGIQTWGELGRRLAQFVNPLDGKSLFDGDADEIKRLEQERDRYRQFMSDRDKQRDKERVAENVRVEGQARTDTERQIADFRRQQEQDLFQARQNAAQKEIDVFRAAGELRLYQIEQANRKMLEGEEGASASALEALNQYILTKERGELDIESAKKDLAIELANLERQLINYRLESEKRIAEIRKQTADYEAQAAQTAAQSGAAAGAATGTGGAIPAATGVGSGFRVGSTGGSTGPHLDIRGSDRESVLREAASIIKKWQDQKVSYIVLPNANIDVTNMRDDAALMRALRSDQLAHDTKRGRRIGQSRGAVDISVPSGTLVPVPASAPWWDPGGGGVTARSLNTGNLLLHGLQGSTATPGGRAAAPSRGAAPASGASPTGAAPALPSTAAYESSLRSLGSSMERLRQLQAQLTNARTKDAFDAIAKAAFPKVELESYQSAIKESQLALRDLSKVSLETYDPELLQIRIAQENELGDKKREIAQIEEKAKARLSPAEFAALQKDLNTENEKYTRDLKEQTRLKEQQLQLDRARASVAGLLEDTLRQRNDTVRNIFGARTGAASAALSPNDFSGRRQLDARSTIFNRYLDETRGGTRALSPEAQAAFQRFAAEALASAKSLALVDEELNKFAEGLQLSRDLSKSLTDSYKGMFASVLQGGDLTEAVKTMSQNISGRFIDLALDYAFKPMEQQLEKLFRDVFGVDDAQIKNNEVLNGLTTEISGSLVPSIQKLTQTIQAAVLPGSGATQAFGGPGIPGLNVPTLDGSAFGSGAFGASPENTMLPFTEGLNVLGDGLTGITDKATEAGKSLDTEAGKGLTGLQKFAGGMASVATAAMSIVGGIQQIGKGGASNVLGGIGSILLGVGGALGGLNGMGLFGKRAGGGAVSARRPYLVGESGPELFLPGASGGVSTANQLRDAMGSGSGGRGGSPMLNMTFETTKIGGTEYVSREQLESAMAATRRQAARDGASRGMSMTLSKLQQSPATRSKVGLR